LKRKKSAEKAVETKIANLMQFVDGINVEVNYIPEPQLTKNAISACNNWNYERIMLDGYGSASEQSDELFLYRIKNNYIRHQLINYDEILAQIRSKVGTHDAYHKVKSKIEGQINQIWQERDQNNYSY
jgi:hypothetical protein